MKITRENYEVFLVDYMDGTLSDQSRQELDSFLLMHNDIKKEFEDLGNYQLGNEETVLFPNKELLKQNEHGYPEVDHLLVAELEGDITQQEAQKLDLLKKNIPELTKDATLYARTVLKPDLSIQFPGKAKLKRTVLRPMFWGYAAAASVVLALVFKFGLQSDNTQALSKADNEQQPQQEIQAADNREETKTQPVVVEDVAQPTEKTQIAEATPAKPIEKKKEVEAEQPSAAEPELLVSQFEEAPDYAAYIAFRQRVKVTKLEAYPQVFIGNELVEVDFPEQVKNDNEAFLKYIISQQQQTKPEEK